MTNARSRRLLLATVGAVSLAAEHTATGNAGTPLMWATAAHLFVGNAVIGVVEGLLVARLLGTGRLRPVVWMIGANYFSAWAGAYLLGRFARTWNPTIENAGATLLALTLASWVATVPLEWPFVAVCAPSNRRRLLRTLGVSALVQTVTYVPLFCWYYVASSATLLTRTHVVPRTVLHTESPTDVFYIGASDGDLWRLHLGDDSPEKLCRLGSSDDDDRLYFARTPENRWVLRLASRGADRDRSIGFAPETGGRSATQRRDEDAPEPGSWFNFGPASDLRDPARRQWSFRTGFWAAEGLRFSEATGRGDSRLSLETPFLAWPVRNATAIPGDQVIFQLGRDQICLLERSTLKLVLLARGRGPAVLLR